MVPYLRAIFQQFSPKITNTTLTSTVPFDAAPIGQ